MPYTLREDPHFSMPKPEAWDDLVALSEGLLIQGEPYLEQSLAVQGIWNVLRTMDDNTYDHNRYYGFGLVIQRLFGTLASEEAQDTVIRRAGGRLARSHQDYCGEMGKVSDRGLYINEIDQRYTYYGLAQTTTEMDAAYQAMRPGVRMLINTLVVGDAPHGEGRNDTLMAYDVKRVLEDERAVLQVTHDIFSNTGSLLRLALLRKYESEKNGGQPLSDERIDGLLVRDTATPEEIASLDFVRTGAIGAAQRLDRFRELFDNHVHLGEDGIFFDPGEVSEPLGEVWQYPPRPHGARTVNHDILIRCPALAVAGVIPFAIKAMPRVVNIAQERIAYINS